MISLGYLTIGFVTLMLVMLDAVLEATLAPGERAVIGVNRHRSDPEPIEVFRIDPAVEATQAASIAAVRERRDAAAVAAALERLAAAAGSGENVMSAAIEAARAYATVGELVGAVRSVHGSWCSAGARL